MADTGDELLERLARAIRDRVRTRAVAETRLSAFAFSEGPAHVGAGADAVAGETPIDWRYFVLRTLGALGDPDSVRVLDAIHGGGRPLDGLVTAVPPRPHDRLAMVDRVASLASAGLVGRDLESDVVALTPLGEALLDLVVDVERRAGRPAT